jgi:pyrimidine operon attenuation protein/uracil phosphoribosyltransferase
MTEQGVLILDQQRIQAKLKRMAYQVWEQNNEEKTLTIIGVAETGMAVARNLAAILQKITPFSIRLIPLHLNKKNPLAAPAAITEDLNNKPVLLVDDVANSGKTLLYALKPILEYMPSRILIAVLLDRTHKIYPIAPDIIGHSIATTLQEHIVVETRHDEIVAAYLR